MRRHVVWSLCAWILVVLAYPALAAAQDSTPDAASPAANEAPEGWNNFKGDAGRAGVGDAGPTGQPVELWRVQAGGPCNAPPAAVAGVVYAPCGDGVLYALDAATGAEQWRFTGSGPLGEVTVTGGTVYLNDGDVIRALDAAGGAELWQAPVVSPTGAVVDAGLLVVGTGDGFLLGLESATGAERWRVQISPNGAAHNPALGGGVAYAGGDDPGFFAVDATSGEILWQGDTGDDQTATAVVTGGIAYIGGTPESGDGHLYAFDAATGALLWQRDEAIFTPAVLDGIGYAGSAAGIVYAFDTATGDELWRVQLGGVVRPVSVAPGAAGAPTVVYAPSDGDRTLYALDAATGQQLWAFRLDGGLDSSVALDGGVAYLGTAFGGIYALGGTDEDGDSPATPTVDAVPTVAASPVAGATPASTVASPAAVAPASVESLWESTGGPEPLGAPLDVTVAPDGNLWVADLATDQFQILTPDGTFVEAWGTPGEGDGEFRFGDGGDVAFDAQGNIFVVEFGNLRVQKFDPDRSFVAAWGGFGPGDGQFVQPFSVAVDVAGNVYVSDYGREDVQAFTADGAYLLTIAGHGDGPGQLSNQGGLTIDAAGNIWVADFGNSRIQRYAPDGTFEVAWGDTGDVLVTPGNLAFDAAGRAYVADTDAHRIVVFDREGQHLGSWGEEGSEPGQFLFPTGIAVGADGTVYVADIGNGRVQAFRLDK